MRGGHRGSCARRCSQRRLPLCQRSVRQSLVEISVPSGGERSSHLVQAALIQDSTPCPRSSRRCSTRVRAGVRVGPSRGRPHRPRSRPTVQPGTRRRFSQASTLRRSGRCTASSPRPAKTRSGANQRIPHVHAIPRLSAAPTSIATWISPVACLKLVDTFRSIKVPRTDAE